MAERADRAIALASRLPFRSGIATFAGIRIGWTRHIIFLVLVATDMVKRAGVTGMRPVRFGFAGPEARGDAASENEDDVQEISVNGISVDPASAQTPELAAVRELLRQHARTLDLVAEGADPETVNSAIRELIAQEVAMAEPTEAECRRYYDSHQEIFQSGARVSARHILFQIPSPAVAADVRAKAEGTLADLLEDAEGFEAAARKLSSCPSSQQGGRLGQLSRGQTVPEFDRAIFEAPEMGVLPDLVQTQFGLHIIAVDERTAGTSMPFEQVEDQIAENLARQGYEQAVRQYIQALAAEAKIVGVNLATLSAQ